MAKQCHAVVTGGGSGIGLAIAAELCSAGFPVTIMGRNLSRLEAAMPQLPNARAIACDVTDPSSIEQAFREAVEAFGPVGILVNNAGVVRTATFARQSDQDWEMMWQTNLLGSVHTIRQVLGPMRELSTGRIVNIGSTASLKGYRYAPAYCASKHALLGLTRALALELAKTGITVNAICPGYADTPIINAAVANVVSRTGKGEEEAREALASSNPQGRLIDPLEVAKAVLWLVSDDARSVTGQALAIAGGEVM